MTPWRVTIDTNPDQCNLNCIMCDTHSIYNQNSHFNRKFMSKELLEKVVDEAIELRVKEIIPSTMGEPLLYKYFDVILEKLSQSDIKLNLTTNGTFPHIGVREWAKKLLPLLSDIKISLNSVDATVNEKIMVNDNTSQKLKDIQLFTKLRDEGHSDVSITLQVTFLDSNLNYLEELILFAIEQGIDRVKGHQLWITFDEVANESLQSTPKKIEKWNTFIDKIEVYRNKIKLENFVKIESRSTQKSYNNNFSCPFLGQELWIDYTGTFNVCCAPSQERKVLGQWGNIKERSISEIFNSQEYKTLLDGYKEEPLCQRCPLKKFND